MFMFFFKPKTAYERRISDWSSDVCSSDLTKLPPEVRKKAVVFAVPADHPPLRRLRAAMRATAIAEAFRHEGKTGLLLIDSLTRVAHAQREIGLTLGEPPTMKGYRSEEHTSELQSLMRISYAVFCLKKKTN